MNTKLFAMAALYMMLSGCNHVYIEDVGVSIYAANNNSPDTVFLVFKVQDHWDSTGVVEPGTTEDFSETTGFGSNPPPSRFLQAVRIYKKADTTLLYDQEPIVDSLWERVKLDDSRYGKVRFTIDVIVR